MRPVALGIRRFGYSERRQCRRSLGRLLIETQTYLWPFALAESVGIPVHRSRLLAWPLGWNLPAAKHCSPAPPAASAGRSPRPSPARGAKLALSARKPEALEALAAELPGDGHTVLPADLAEPGAAEQLAAAAGARRRPRRQRRPAGLRPARRLQPPRRCSGALRVNLEAPMLLARALYPGMLERGSGHLVFVASLSGKAASPALFDLQRDQVRPARLRPGLRADLAPRGSASRWSRPGFIRDAGMFADPAPSRRPGSAPPPPSRSPPASSRRSSATRSRSPSRRSSSASLAHLGLTSPASRSGSQSGSGGPEGGGGGRRRGTPTSAKTVAPPTLGGPPRG